MSQELNIKTNVETEQAEKSTTSLIDKFDQLLDLQKEQLELSKKAGSDTKKSLDSAAKGTKGLAAGFKGVGLAIKAAGIGILISVLGVVQDLFRENQAVMDGFNTAFNFLSKAVNDFTDFVFGNFGKVQEFFTAIFDDPIGSIKSLGEAIRDNLIERFVSLIESAKFLGKAMALLFKKDFAGAWEAAKEAGAELVDVMTGVDNSAEKISNTVSKGVEALTAYTKETYNAAKASTELNKQSQIAAAQQQLLIERYDREAEKLRQLRDDDRLTFEQRIAANEKLGEVLDRQADSELRLVDIQMQRAKAALALNNNVENQVALIEAQAAREEVLARIEGFRSEQLINRNALEREAVEEAKKNQQELDDLLDMANNNLDKAEKERTDIAQKAEEERQKIKVNTIQKGFAIASELAEEGTVQAKAVAAAQATFDTYAAIAGNLAAFSKVPIPGYAIAQAIATGVFGLLQVRKILSTSTKGTSAPSLGGGGGGGGGAATGGQSINQQLPNFEFINQGVGGQQNAEFGRPIRAYVVNQNIKDENALADRINDNAKLN